MICSKCGSATEFKQGVSKKTGNPWKGYKCVACGNLDFINEKAKPKQNHPSTPENIVTSQPSNDTQIKSIIMSYAKDIVVAQINSGIKIVNPFDGVIIGFRLLLGECKEPGSTLLDDQKNKKENEEQIPF